MSYKYLNRIGALLLSVAMLLSVACTGGENGESVSSSSSSVVSDTSSAETESLPEEDGSLSAEELQKYSYRPVISEIMPAVFINTADGSNDFATQYKRADKLIDAIDYVDAVVNVGNCEAEYALDGAEAEVKVRGNYTLEYDKKPIRIKFKEKQGMLGLHDGEKYKNWVLLADWKDLSMLNNSTAFYLGNVISGSDGYYCTDFRNVELYLNGEYWGVYLLVEQQEVKDGRMSVPEVEDGYTGTDIGYMFEFDGYYEEEREMPNGSGDPTFTIEYSDERYEQIGYTVKSDINSDEQLEFLQFYIQNSFNIVHAAVVNDNHLMFNSDYTDIMSADTATVKETVGKVIDLQSLVDMYILHEIACDPDIDWSSFYMSVDMTADGAKKIIFEAPWDFDSAFGIKKKFTETDGLFAAGNLNPWLSILSGEQWFIDMVKEKWEKLKQAEVPKTALELITEQKTTYEKYYVQNYVKWEKRVQKGNSELTSQVNSYKTEAEAADHLYNWLEKRFEYLDSQWGQ